MLRIVIPSAELWDDEAEEFVYTKPQALQLEHSLVSLSKWESKWGRPFLSEGPRTFEETVDYVKQMTLTQNVDPKVYRFLTNANMEAINAYISAPMTATRIPREKNSRGNREKVTAELIYYWMIALNIPFECQKWHLNRLIALIDLCSIKNQPPKKRSRRELLQRNAALNAARRKQWNTKG